MFLTSRLASTGDRSPYGSFWFEPVGARSGVGARVTSGSAMRLSAVYSCVRVLAETFAVLPFVLYKKKSNGGRTMVTDHWLYRLLAKRPNNWQTPFEWREMMMGHLALRGNAFNEIVADGAGEILQLIPLHPDRVKMELLDNGSFRYTVAQRDGSSRTLMRGQVWHIRGLSGDGYMGYNPIEVAAEVLGLGIAAQGFGARFYANDAKPGGWIELAGKFADDATRQTFKDSWKKSQGGGNRGSTAVLESGMKYHELTINNSDAQFLETRKFNRSEIAAIFRVPPHKIGDLEKATFSNIEQQSLDFVNDGMSPWSERWESSIETNLLYDNEELEVEFDFKNLLRGDSKARASYYNSGIVAGWMTRNEARIQEGMDPIEGLDEPLQPLNMVAAGEQPEEEDDDQDPGRDGNGDPVAPEDWPIALDTAFEKHAGFVAAALGVELLEAKAYCSAQWNVAAFNRGLDASVLLTETTAKLERLALKGTL
jgi:HK97 family phage portal protein